MVSGGYRLVNNYEFSKNTLSFLNMVETFGFGMGVRDIYTYQILKQKGFKKVYLTGCPAWYDIELANSIELQNDNWSIKNICISDPADPKNYSLLPNIIQYLKRSFPNSDITLVFHRGISKALDILKSDSKELFDNLSVMDITGRDDGFSVYDSADLHIGFRVHAHIYSLSRRRKTILIEEDGRGAGVNETLGIPSILAYDDCLQVDGIYLGKIQRKVRFRNHKLIENIDSHIQLMMDTNNIHLKNAFRIQEESYRCMREFIRNSLSGLSRET